MDLTTLDKPVAEIAGLMTADLVTLDTELDAASELLKRRKNTFNALLARRFEEEARKKLVAENKDTGTVNLVSNGIGVKAVFAKEVDWDQAKLRAAADAMTPEDARHYVKVEMKVDERKYTAAPPAVQAALKDARTVKAKKPAFSFKVEDAAAA